jgi:hypothetical protein
LNRRPKGAAGFLCTEKTMAGPSNLPPQMPPPFPPQYPQQKQTNPLKIVLIIFAIFVGLSMFGGLAMGILAVAVMPKVGPPRNDFETRQLFALKMALEGALDEPKNRHKLEAMQDKAGRAFWNDCFKKGLLDPELLRKLVCLGSYAGDTAAESTLWIEDPNAELAPANCSYTSPKASELRKAWGMKGANQVVLFTFDSRNWKSYEKIGVLCAWSDGEVTWMTFEEASTKYGIAQSQWNDPANELFGKKHPFEYTHEK